MQEATSGLRPARHHSRTPLKPKQRQVMLQQILSARIKISFEIYSDYGGGGRDREPDS